MARRESAITTAVLDSGNTSEVYSVQHDKGPIKFHWRVRRTVGCTCQLSGTGTSQANAQENAATADGAHQH